MFEGEEEFIPFISTIYVVTCSTSVHDCTFFVTKELARQYLQKLAKERQHCRNFEFTNDSFSYTMGWEERRIVFKIYEFPVVCAPRP
jgi:hypothetical protein